MDSVHQKLYRAKHHYEELHQELLAYYSAQETVQIRLAANGIHIGNTKPVPARFGLIAGDTLQCFRSALDYLVWELVLANNGTPTQQNAFPISLTGVDYKNEVEKRRRLHGVNPSACALINKLQPFQFPEPEREQSPLALLDKLTNINKHRRVLLTNLERKLMEDQPFPFPHILSGLTARTPRWRQT